MSSSSSTIEFLTLSRDPRRIGQVKQQSNNIDSGIPSAVDNLTTTIGGESSSNRSVEEIRSGLQAFHKKRRLERTALGDTSSPSSSSRATTTNSGHEGDTRLREFHSKFLSERFNRTTHS